MGWIWSAGSLAGESPSPSLSLCGQYFWSDHHTQLGAGYLAERQDLGAWSQYRLAKSKVQMLKEFVP